MHSDRTSRRTLLGALAAAAAPAGCLERTSVNGNRGDGAGNSGANGSQTLHGNDTHVRDDARRNESDGSDEATGHDGEGNATETDEDADREAAYEDVGATLEDEPLAEQFDCEEISRPTSDVEGGETVELENEDRTVELVGALPYPETPAERPEGDTLREFVVDHETAYQRNRVLEDDHGSEQDYRLSSHDVDVTVADVDRRDDVTFVLASVYSYTRALHPEVDREDATGQLVLTALYAIDDSGSARQPIYEIKTDQSLDDEVLLSIVEPSAWELVECR